jgi:hypothetical protein
LEEAIVHAGYKVLMEDDYIALIAGDPQGILFQLLGSHHIQSLRQLVWEKRLIKF